MKLHERPVNSSWGLVSDSPVASVTMPSRTVGAVQRGHGLVAGALGLGRRGVAFAVAAKRARLAGQRENLIHVAATFPRAHSNPEFYVTVVHPVAPIGIPATARFTRHRRRGSKAGGEVDPPSPTTIR